MSGDLATSLREVWDAKKNLRHTLKVPKDIPFNKYIDYYPWLGEDIPEDGLAYDFTRNRYSQEGVPVLMGDISEFIRLSSATEWRDGQLVEVQNNIPRISSAGLLVEKSVTESIPDNLTITSFNTDWAATSKPDTQIGNVFEFVSDGSVAEIRFNVSLYPNGNVGASSGYYYRSILAKKSTTDSFLNLGTAVSAASIVVNLKNGSLEFEGSLVVESKITEINEYYLIESLAAETGAVGRQFRLHASDNRGSASALAEPTIGHKVTVALPSFMDTADFPQSFVKTSGTQVTRSPDILNIPLLPTQSPTGDWDAGVTYTVDGGIATLVGHGYIRNIVVMLTPLALFKKGEKGFWIEPDDSSTLFQNSNGTIPAVDGDPIGLVSDKSGNNYNLTQTVSASRPKLLDGGIAFDKVDDALTLDVPAGGITGTLFLATTRGTASYGVSMPAGVWTIGNRFNPLGNVVSAVLVDRVLSEEEKDRLHVFGVGKGGTEFGVEASFVGAFREWSHLVEFPLLDTSSVTNFQYAWSGCSSLVEFPLLDSSSVTFFQYAWQHCSSLVEFPLLDTSSVTNFTQAWQGCLSLVEFPLLDASSALSFNQTWSGCSSLVEFPLLDVSNGTNFLAAWQNCSGLTSFPVLDVSNSTNFYLTWNGCSGLTSFPVLDVSKGTNFNQAWNGCSGLTSFPTNFFDNCLATNFSGAFTNTKLSQASIDGILVSINSNATSNGTFSQSGGSAPSSVGQAAIDAMRSRGWTVTVTGGY